MLKTLKRFVAVATVVTMPAIFAQSAHAAMMWDYSYDFGGGQNITGTLTGDLQLDLDTIHITDITGIITTPSGPYNVDTLTYYVDQNFPPHDTFGIVSLSGLTMDLVLHRIPTPHGGSCGNIDSVCLITVGNFAFVGGRNVGYDPDNWTIGRVVSEPSIITLFGLGLLGFGIARRRKVQA